MTKNVLIAMFLLSSMLVVPMQADDRNEARFFPTVALGVISMRNAGIATVEGGVVYTDPLSSVGPQVVGPRLTIEAGYGNPGWLAGIRAGYELSALIFTLRASAGAYTNFNGGYMVSFIPEAGFGWLGMMTFGLGAVVPVVHNDMLPTSVHLALTYNIGIGAGYRKKQWGR